MGKIDPATRVLPPPGVYRGVPDVHYHGWKGAAASSELRILPHKSPAHIEVRRKGGGKPTEAMLFGSMVHDLVLRPELFDQLYVVGPDLNKNSNAYKATAGRILSEKPFVHLVDQEDLDRAHGAKQSLRDHELAGPAFFSTNTEVSLVWNETVEVVDPSGEVIEITVPAKARLDAWDAAVGIADLKVTGDVSEEAVARKVQDFRYDLQAGWYLRSTDKTRIDVIPEFAFFFLEDKDPWDIQMFQVSARVLNAAAATLDDVLPIWAKCQHTGVWPKSPPVSKELPITYRLNLEVERRVPGLVGV